MSPPIFGSLFNLKIIVRMACYSIENHQLTFYDGLSTLSVINTDNSEEVESYNLSSSPYKLEMDGDDYKITAVSLPTGQFRQEFKVAEEDSFGIVLRTGIGISDLRTTRSNFEYDLDGCPIIMKYADSALGVYSPCTGGCAQPASACCEINPVT
jgi:hypothetical protein